ncbi:MAG: hypothetical protein DRQ47_09475 [Gammaproteobacteria bacterium]|nr:MAG: hypothetical protein DRQ47_09475 [Gammaproteobacteria bacterium]
MKKLTTLALAGSLLAASSAAMAWESENGAHSITANVAMTSDYVWRGYSQTDEEMAIQGGFDYAHSSGIYIGTWASNIDFGSDASIEVDVYGGWATEFNGWGIDLGLLQYMYPSESDLDFLEFYGSVSYSIATVGVAYSSDVYGSSDTGIYYNLGLDYGFDEGAASGLGLKAGVGYYDYDEEVFGNPDVDSAVDYYVGAYYDIAGSGFVADVTYYDTDSDGETLYGENLADGRFVFTISKSM